MNNKILIWGASGHALVITNIIEMTSDYEIYGYIDDVYPENKRKLVCGRPVLGGREVLTSLLKKGVTNIALGFGHCNARLQIGELLEKMGFNLPPIIHPKSVVAQNVEISKGAVICPGVIIDPDCKIGRFALINNNATICHGTNIAEAVHICPGVIICGNASIGSCTWIGAGSTIIESLTIGRECFVGSNTNVVNNIQEKKLVLGNPGKEIREVLDVF